ncbi:MAG: hypothetical protein Q4B70_19110 [Lachnospiraceae bacterium]|nr:hypothetical protein [Lachnospiraceae bacterium]
MKKWNTPELKVLDMSETANGQAPDPNFDDVWVEIDGKWYRPGNGTPSSINE